MDLAGNRRERQAPGTLLLLILGMKLLVFLLGVFCYEVYSNQRIEWPDGFFAIWNQWDCPNYLLIAEQGYQAQGEKRSNLAFFPLYPVCISGLRALGVPTLLAAFLISTVASLAVGLLLYRLARLEMSAPRARRAVWLLFAFPTAYFLHIGMTESLFLALALGTFLAARQRRWLLAGVLGYLAVLCRMNGLWLLPALLAEVWLEYRETGRLRGEWLALLAIPVGVGTYLLINYAVTGDPLAFLRFQREHWNHQLTWPWVGILNSLLSFRWHEPSNAQMVGGQEFLFALLGLIISILALWKQRLSYGVWCLGNWLLWTSMDFLTSTPRYTLLLFPLYLLASRLSPSGAPFLLLISGSLLLQGVFISIWVQGGWAF